MQFHPPTHVASRRRFLRTVAAGSAGYWIQSKIPAATDTSYRVLATQIISLDAQNYHGWPTLTQRWNGQLLVVCSGGREQHVCPFGRVDLLVSNDQGRTWSWPRTLLDSDLDDRDAGLLETARGTLLVTSFTSLAYESALAAAEKDGSWKLDRLRRWQAARDRLTADRRQAELGQWMIRSIDGGLTWSPRYPSLVNSPHGPIQLADGRLLYAGKELWTGLKRVGVSESRDDGQTWQWLSEIPSRPGDTAAQYHELHAVECASGRLVAQIRNHNPTHDRETLQTESDDGGRTWSIPHPIGVWGLPSHLLRRRNNELLMTYGYRREPFGIQARRSQNEGQTWSAPLRISTDGAGSDLGYPSTIELEDRTLLTVWYERMPENPRAVLRQATWTIKD